MVCSVSSKLKIESQSAISNRRCQIFATRLKKWCNSEINISREKRLANGRQIAGGQEFSRMVQKGVHFFRGEWRQQFAFICSLIDFSRANWQIERRSEFGKVQEVQRRTKQNRMHGVKVASEYIFPSCKSRTCARYCSQSYFLKFFLQL